MLLFVVTVVSDSKKWKKTPKKIDKTAEKFVDLNYNEGAIWNGAHKNMVTYKS